MQAESATWVIDHFSLKGDLTTSCRSNSREGTPRKSVRRADNLCTPLQEGLKLTPMKRKPKIPTKRAKSQRAMIPYQEVPVGSPAHKVRGRSSLASGSIVIKTTISITTVIFYGTPRARCLASRAREEWGRAQSPRGLPPTPLRGREPKLFTQLFKRIAKASPRTQMSQIML
jgi:hypothetical protein